MIPSDAALLALVAVAGVVQVILLVALYREVVWSRRDAKEARARDLRLLERALSPQKPPERRRVGFRVHRADESDDAASVVRERAG